MDVNLRGGPDAPLIATMPSAPARSHATATSAMLDYSGGDCRRPESLPNRVTAR